ncbi:prolyl oligopeptidase family serine peptidase [Glutamicibacter sp. MNS18]|uniref:S9 family peptidase n=1 Tax=Glutamicibacter sp. MNS18 TaxID=2989817 RepID=UPI002235620C|nr:prolyl oligopeptidase family serine peptidase [Glutamicibacter sp. MNS18]MCW4467094.1 prolyl oligopeptidase family serine peptidase [Glutamicibacter sp. MNS18]
MPTRLDYGSWPSLISAADVAAGTKPLGGADFLESTVIIQQARPEQGGRITLWQVDLHSGEPLRELVPEPFNVRSRVHEYGGASWILVDRPQPQIIFANFTDQRLYALGLDGGPPRALTPDSLQDTNPLLRFAELVPGITDGQILAIMEDNTDEPVRRIVSIPLDGSAATNPEFITKLTPAARFVAAPRLSPNREKLCWISWDHPNMPWDGTELHLASVTAHGLDRIGTIAGGSDVSVMQPEWLDDRRLVFISDESGWWNPQVFDLDTGRGHQLVDMTAEFAGPLWQAGSTWYLVESSRSLLMSYGTGLTGLARVSADGGELQPLELPYTRIRPLQLRGSQLLAATSSMRDGEEITLIDLDTLHARSMARAIEHLPPADELPEVEELRCLNADGQEVHALLYRPHNNGYAGPDGALPPYITMVHGGPTAQAAATLTASVAYYTSRGIGVVDVNYGGSSGYGREYRNRLRGQWGVVDVQDTVAVIDALIARGIADPERIGIEGGSAGGWTVLCALTFSDRFRAGISRYGVSDLVSLVSDTHDFESRYMFSLVGPYPEAAELYAQRAPINHLEKLDCPVLVLQGDEDKVVPPAQSEVVVNELARRGIPHAYILFEGEQHGFRKEANIVRALESSLAFYAQVFGFAAGVAELELA